MVLNNHEEQQKYVQHRLRVHNAKSVVNSLAPKPKLRIIDRKNLSYDQLLAELNGSMRGNSSVLTFSKTPDVPCRYANRYSTNTRSRCEVLSTRSSTIESSTSRHSSLNNESKRRSSCMFIPDVVLQRYQYLTNDLVLLRRLLRPRVFLDVEVKGIRPLGRLTIQLYTEACPEVVVEFVRICSSDNTNRINITRLFTPLWLEGKLTLDDSKTLAMPSIEHDSNVLDHGCGAGVLSFPSRYVRGSKRRFLTFSISFKPLKVLNGKRIAFGQVRRGNWILDVLQDYSTNNGKPRNEIVVTKCGMMK